MSFNDNEEQQLFAASIARFVERDCTFENRRKSIASPEGYSEKMWKTMAELGLLGLPVPREYGGFGGGATETMVVMEAIGSALIVEPFLATVGLGARFIARAGTAEQMQRILPAVADGTTKLAFAHTETSARYDLAHVATRARRTDDGGFLIDGEKRVVVHAASADALIVSARTAGDVTSPEGIELFIVDSRTPGIARRDYRTLDAMRAADVLFSGVRVPAGARLGEGSAGLTLIEEVVDYATALVCAEAIGAIRYANDATLEYLKTRQQFGVPIGTFQALQHRMVDMAIEYEQAKSMAYLACRTVDSETDPIARRHAVSAAKVRIADACRLVSQEAVQLHGGMGMSDEVKVSHTFRRLTIIAQQFGDADHHLDRFART